MPRTTLVLPTSTTSRLDIENRLLRHHQIARADRHHFIAISQQRAARFVDSNPGAAGRAIADDAGDAVAGLVHGERPPLRKNHLAIEGIAEPLVEMFDECLDGRRDATEIALGDLADRDRVRAAVIVDRLDIDSDADDQEQPVVLHAGLDEDAGDLAAVDQDVVRPLDSGIDRKYIT